MTVSLRISRDENGVPVLDRARRAIGTIESAGSGDYAAIGPKTKKGDRAYGRYQVMGANIPAWTKEALGKKMSAKQFLADPSAQDAVFNHFFKKFMDQTGNPQDAASMWFSGKPLAQARGRRDVTGTKAEQYVNNFNREFGSPSSSTSSGVPSLGSFPEAPAATAPAESLTGTSSPLPSLEFGGASERSPVQNISPGLVDLTGGQLGTLALPQRRVAI